MDEAKKSQKKKKKCVEEEMIELLATAAQIFKLPLGLWGTWPHGNSRRQTYNDLALPLPVIYRLATADENVQRRRRHVRGGLSAACSELLPAPQGAGSNDAQSW